LFVCGFQIRLLSPSAPSRLPSRIKSIKATGVSMIGFVVCGVEFFLGFWFGCFCLYHLVVFFLGIIVIRFLWGDGNPFKEIGSIYNQASGVYWSCSWESL